MSANDTVRIGRDELFGPDIDKALARERAGRERIVADLPPVSPVRRLLNNSLFHMPLAALCAALVCWFLLEPDIEDFPSVGGEVLLVNADPFDAPGFIVLTVGEHAVYVDPLRVELERGAGGEPALASVEAIAVGDRIEATGLTEDGRLIAGALRPSTRGGSYGTTDKPLWPLILLFPLTAMLIALGLLVAEGITTRNWLRMIQRTLLGSFLAGLFALLAFIPAGFVLLLQQKVFDAEMLKHSDLMVVTVDDIGGFSFLLITACRSAAWACIGAACGVGMNLARSTRTQLRNSTIGGALGGALGGMFFDPIERFVGDSMFGGADVSRLVGLIAVGLSIGVFVALVERLAREAWLRVRTGPLAGKSFILYKTPTLVGNAPSSDVYLYKDAEIDPSHASVHRVGTTYEVEDLGSRAGTQVNGQKVRRRRLVSGDQVVIGNTILDFEERQKRTPVA
jgi:hypothetical protein